MENQFFVDSEYLSPAALEKKHRLETDPSSRKNHMEYMPGMEQISSEICGQVMSQMEAYDYSKYKNDVSLKGEFMRLALEEKADEKTISAVINALNSEELPL